MATPAQIKKLHALKTALNLDEPTYRKALSDYGVKSSKDRRFTIADCDKLIKQWEKDAIAQGVWEERKPAKRAKAAKVADDPQSNMLRGMWIELHKMGKVKDPTEKALRKFVKRMTGVDNLGWLNNEQVTKVKKALKDWQERQEVKPC